MSTFRYRRPDRSRTAATCGALMWVAMIIVGCAGEPEKLERIPKENIAGVELSGQWQMQDDFRAMQRRLERAVRDTDGVDESKLLRRASAQPRRRSGRSRDVGGLVHVFLENAALLKITQTADGLFIGFDRSVVEEYRFGELRRITTGGAVALRASGWDGGDYVIETLDESGMKLTERYSLTPTDELTREITLRSEKLEQITIVQTFERVSG